MRIYAAIAAPVSRRAMHISWRRDKAANFLDALAGIMQGRDHVILHVGDIGGEEHDFNMGFGRANHCRASKVSA